MNVQFGALTQASGSIRIANSAYQKWPTKRFPFYVYLRLVLKNSIFATKPILPIKSLRIRPGQKKAPKRLIIRFTRQNWIFLLKHASCSKEHFGENQLLPCSISLSPLYPNQTNNLHVSTVAWPPPAFLLASP